MLGCPPPPGGAPSTDAASETSSASPPGPSPRSCRLLPEGSASGVYFIDPDGDDEAAPFEVYCNAEIAGGGWILVGRIGDRAEIDRDAFDWDLDLAGLRDDGEPNEFQYSHFDLARFDPYGSTWTVMVQLDLRHGLPPLPDIERFTFFRPRAGVELLANVVGRDWEVTKVERSLEHLTASKVDRAWYGGRDNATWLASDGEKPGDPVPGFHLMGHVDRTFPEHADRMGITPDCIDAADQTRGCHQTAGMLDADAGGIRRGASSGSPYRDGGTFGADENSAQYWIRDDRVDRPQAE